MSTGILSSVTAGPVPRAARKGRRPVHPFQVRHHPWQLCPIMCAPVLPGDTLQNILLQARAVSDPVKHPLIGWWLEYYFFYVPHRSMPNSASYQAIMLDPTLSVATIAGADPFYYRAANEPDWIGECLNICTKTFFRDEGEEAYGATPPAIPFIGTGPTTPVYPPAQINNTSWLDSAMTLARFTTENADVEVEGPDANTTIQASEIDKAMRQWQLLRDNHLTDQTYEDFLRTYGVRIPDREQVILPELIRYVREWTYPSNTINPADGAPSSALSWSIAERADKNRFFKEPGFLFGITLARPKVYLSKQRSSAVELLRQVFQWLPAVLGDDPYSSLVQKTPAVGPLSGQTTDYIVDVKDLFLYGDQFVNFDLAATDAGMVALPSATLQKKYATTADVAPLFKGGTLASSLVRQDGIANLTFSSRVVDTTAKT